MYWMTYCYETEEGVVVDRVFQMGKAPAEVTLPNGKVAKRSFRAEHSPRTARGEGWPMAPCYASGVHPSQAGELRKFFFDSGVKTDVTSNGDPIYTSPSHRKAALKVRGLHDKASY